MRERTLYLKKSSPSGYYNSWTYPMWDGLTWGSEYAKASIYFMTYDSVLNVWNGRGSPNMNNLNLFTTTEDNLSLYDFNNNLVARFIDGEMVYSADGVIDVKRPVLLPDNNNKQANMFYAPKDLYTVVDDSPNDPIEIMMADDMLSVRLKTDADNFNLCADGASDVANAILTPDEGTQYMVSLGTLIDGSIEEISIEGLGTGEAISIGLESGELSIMGADSAELSIHTLGDSYSIDADCTAGGSITNKGVIEYPAGLNARYQIKADDGYKIRSVYVDGEDVGPVDEYYFENITSFHTIKAFFSKDISTCTFELTESEYHYSGSAIEPSIVLRDGESTMTAGADYMVSYENNVNQGNAVIHVTAVADSNYYGVTSVTFEIKAPVFGTPDFTLPNNLLSIEESAFEEIAAKAVYIPDFCMSIGPNAFCNSTVAQIRIPASCSIADTAFSGCELVFIFGKAGSPAEAYCTNHENCQFFAEP